MGWREGCESVLNVGMPCNISTAALPAAAHPPFPSAIPLSFLCLESLFLHTHGLCGSPPHSHSGLAPPPSQPGGFDVSLGWRFGHGVAQATGSPCPPSPKQGPRGCRMRFGQRGRGPAGWGAGQGSCGSGCGTGVPGHPSGEQPGACPAPCTVADDGDGAGRSEVQLPGFRLVFIFQAERKLVIPKPFCV